MKYLITLFTLLLCIFYTTQAQKIEPELLEKLKGKSKLQAIMKVVDKYYANEKKNEKKKENDEPEEEDSYLHWKRWEWYQCRHLDINGDFVNSNEKNYAVIEQLKQNNFHLKGTNTQSPLSNTGNWFSFGPSAITGGIGRVDRLAFHPTDPNHLYAGTPAGGLWQSYDGGNNWSSITGYVPSLGVSGIVVDKVNPNTIYVLSGDGDDFANAGIDDLYRVSIGILKSTDAGVTWTRIPLPATVNTYYGNKLIQLPGNNNILMTGTSNGLFRSTDYGVTWTKNPNIIGKNVFDIEVSPYSSAIVFASTESDVYYSSDYGASFNLIFYDPNGSFQKTTLCVSANSPNGLYVNFTSSNLLYFSSNNGSSFTLKNNNSPTTSRYTSSIAASQTDVNTILMGSLGVSKSTDGGATFPIGGAGIHADIHDLQYNPLDNVLYAGCDGGVYKSIDNGANWIPLLNGMNATQYYHMAGFQGNDGLIVAGAQDNGVHLRNGSNNFSNIGTGDGFDAKFLNSNSNTLFFSINAGIFKNTISTASSAYVFLPPKANGDINNQAFFFPNLAVHPTNDNIIYAGYGSFIYRSSSGGNRGTWDSLGGSASTGFGAAGGLAVSANVPDRLYAANSTTAQLSENKGNSWTTISGNPGWVDGVITDIKTRSNNASEVWVTFGGYGTVKVLYSSNAGASWTNLTGSLPNLPVYCVEYTSDGDAYIGTDAGVYFMAAAMNDWVFFSNGLPLLPVTELYADIGNNSIKAATFGRGVWKSDLYASCPASLNLTDSPNGSFFYQANGNITTTQNITGSYGNSVRYRSPATITLQNGFKAMANSYLHVVNGPCGQGVFSRVSNENTAAPKNISALTAH